MIAECRTAAINGTEVNGVIVQVKLLSGIPSFAIVGLPDRTIAESKERIKAAISNLSLSFPLKKVIVNLSPANLYKEGSHYDLPIALALLAEMGIFSAYRLKDYTAIGELSLCGKILPAKGSIVIAIDAIKDGKKLLCSINNAIDSSILEESPCLPADNLLQVINHLKETEELKPIPFKEIDEKKIDQDSVFDDIAGQFLAKRALLIAAIGRHNMILSGPPGCGKSLLAKKIIHLLPTPTLNELIEINMINGISAQNFSSFFTNERPFRSPHFSCSTVAMIGGGKDCAPGEITLAHNGVLFLDELPEFCRQSLEALRQPMEDKKITISRSSRHVTYMSNFQLICSMNECKCGNFGIKEKECKRAPYCHEEYIGKISSPILDRIDLFIKMTYENPISEQLSKNQGLKNIKETIQSAAERQSHRYKNCSDIKFNSMADFYTLKKIVLCSAENERILKKIIEKRKISARSIAKIMSISLSISDLDQSCVVNSDHIKEASFMVLSKLDAFC